MSACVRKPKIISRKRIARRKYSINIRNCAKKKKKKKKKKKEKEKKREAYNYNLSLSFIFFSSFFSS